MPVKIVVKDPSGAYLFSYTLEESKMNFQIGVFEQYTSDWDVGVKALEEYMPEGPSCRTFKQQMRAHGVGPQVCPLD